jgi:branched-chain amino acid transport system substrate-binding protein
MVPGQHHLRMNMYIGQVQNGRMKVVKELGVLDPKERKVEGGQVSEGPQR